MKKDKGKEVTNSRCSYPVYFCLALILVILNLSVEGCANMDKGQSNDSIGSISFSPDGKKILFNRRNGGNTYYMIQVYDLRTGELSAYRSPNDEEWYDARYSFDGKRIVFGIMPHKGNQWDIVNSQIAIMAPDGSNRRKITSTKGFKTCPSFSHDGKKIIYVRAGKLRDEGKTVAKDYDIYEVDLETGVESRLTWFKFFMMSPPYYFPDDESFIFSAYGPPFIFSGIVEGDYGAIQKKQAILKDIRGRISLDDDIYVIKKGQRELSEPLIKSKDGLRNPLLTKDGRIFFKTQAYKPDGSGDWEQFFQYSTDGKHKRITNLKATTIWSGAVSNDGELLAIVYDVAPVREIYKIVIYQVKDGSRRDITLSDQPSRIINAPKQTKKVLNVR